MDVSTPKKKKQARGNNRPQAPRVSSEVLDLPRPTLLDLLLRSALRMASFFPALQVHILTLIFARERRKRGIR